jgi:Na+-driven multidrug efflux pump
MAIVLGAAGWVAAPGLLNLANAAPDVHDAALPFLRTMFAGIIGMMMFFMLSGAFRAAGEPAYAAPFGVAMTVLTILFNIVLIPGLRHGRRSTHRGEQAAWWPSTASGA